MLSLFAVLTLILGGVGVYGVASQSVVRRRREIGVRLALGASPAEVRRQVMRESGTLVAGGLALGLVLSVPTAGLMRGLLFGIGSLDPVTYVGVTIVLSVVAVAAAWWPARLASRTDVLIVMRQE